MYNTECTYIDNDFQFKLTLEVCQALLIVNSDYIIQYSSIITF